MKTYVFFVFTFVFCFSCFHFVLADSWNQEFQSKVEDFEGVDKKSSQSFGLYSLFPAELDVNSPKTITLFDIKPEIQGPSCQNPGFMFNFSGYVASFAKMQDYLDENLKSALLGVGLIYLESLFPEYATIQKHLNKLAMYKKSLDNFSCEGVMNTIRKSDALPSLRPYAGCIEKEVGKGNTRDDAEVICSETLSQVYKFLGDHPEGVEEFNLTKETFDHAKRLRDSGDNKIPDNALLDELAYIIGQVKIFSNGRHIQKETSLNAYIIKMKTDIETAIYDLVAECDRLFSEDEALTLSEKICPIKNSYLDGYKSFLALKYPNADGLSWIISLPTIQELTRTGDPMRSQAIDTFAISAAIHKGRLLVDLWKYVVESALIIDGSDEYKELYSQIIVDLQTQIESIVEQTSQRQSLVDIENIIKSINDQQRQDVYFVRFKP